MTEQQLSHLKNTLCALCLSVDRKLYYIENEKLVQLLNIQIFESEKVCFECKSIITKISSFRANAISARTVLVEMYKNLVSNSSFLITTFSRLKTCELKSVCIHPVPFNSVSDEGKFDQDFKQKPDTNGLGSITAIKVGHNIIKSEITGLVKVPKIYVKETLSAQAMTVEETDSKDNISENNLVQTSIQQICQKKYLSEYSNCSMLDSKSDVSAKYNLLKTKSIEHPAVLRTKRPMPLFKVYTQDRLDEILASTSMMNVEQSLHAYGTIMNSREVPMIDNKAICRIEKITKEEVIKCREKKRNCKKYLRPIFKCEKCIEVFPTEDFLKDHLIKHTESYGPLLCDICDLRFRSYDEAEDHKYIHYTRYQCFDCDFDTDDRVEMYEHYQLMHEIDPKDCETCGVPQLTKYLFRKHMKQRHKVKPLCDLCGVKCADYDALKQHVSLHEEVPDLECPVCFKKYKGTWGLRFHLRKIHKDNKRGGEETYYCDECKVQFKNFHIYKTHLETTRKHIKGKEMKYSCTECDKKFITAAYLKSHMKSIHTSTETFECGECDKAYNTHGKLKVHIRRVHENIPKARNHVCEFCAKAFIQVQTLNDHRNIHLGRRPYVCNVCGDTFSFSSALYIHTQLKHLKVKRKKPQKKER